MTRKRAIKKLMGRGYSRNEAAFFLPHMVECFGCNKAVVSYIYDFSVHRWYNKEKLIFGVDLNNEP